MWAIGIELLSCAASIERTNAIGFDAQREMSVVWNRELLNKHSGLSSRHSGIEIADEITQQRQ
jgi:hypothetical protein